MLPAIRRPSLLPLLLTSLAAPLAAQNLSLDKVGGALGAVTTFPIQGQPGEFYALAIDIFEQPTPLPQYGVKDSLNVSVAFGIAAYGLVARYRARSV